MCAGTACNMDLFCVSANRQISVPVIFHPRFCNCGCVFGFYMRAPRGNFNQRFCRAGRNMRRQHSESCSQPRRRDKRVLESSHRAFISLLSCQEVEGTRPRLKSAFQPLSASHRDLWPLCGQMKNNSLITLKGSNHTLDISGAFMWKTLLCSQDVQGGNNYSRKKVSPSTAMTVF